MSFNSIKKVFSLSALCFGLASSSALFALELKCDKPVVKYLEDKKVPKRIFPFVSTQSCTVEGVQNVDFEKLKSSYVDGLKSLYTNKKKKDRSFEIKKQSRVSYQGEDATYLDIVNERDTKHGDMTIDADMYLVAGKNSFKTSYVSKGKIEAKGHAKNTKKITDTTKMSLTKEGVYSFSVKREVDVKKPRMLPMVDKHFAEAVVADLDNDLETLTAMHKEILKVALDTE